TPGKMYVKRAGLLDDVQRFDAEFFGVPHREATGMDPQQRMLLEVAWRALESAGHAPGSLAGTKTGVYVGICGSDYARLTMRAGDHTRIDPYVGTGTASS